MKAMNTGSFTRHRDAIGRHPSLKSKVLSVRIASVLPCSCIPIGRGRRLKPVVLQVRSLPGAPRFMETKICKGCRLEKTLAEFSLHKNCRLGRNSKCKSCKNKLAAVYWKTKMSQLSKDERKQHNKLKWYKRYGIAFEDYQSMVKQQDGACRICATTPSKLHLDHSHETNLIRGLLCANCNMGLGLFYDSPLILSKAIEYLEAGQAGNGYGC